MALDPKQVVKENVPLVACYAAAVAAIAVYALVVMPLAGDIARDDREGRQALNKNEVPAYEAGLKKVKSVKSQLTQLRGLVDEGKLKTSIDKAAYEERNAKLEEQVGSLVDLYIEADKRLERWFPELNLETMSEEPGGNPDFGQFSELYKSKFEKLKKQYGDLLKGSPEDMLVFQKPGSSPAGLIRTQKNYWYKQDILRLLTDSKAKRLLSDISVLTAGSGELQADFVELNITFSAELSFSQLPVVVRSILASDLVYEVRSVKIQRQDFSYKVDEPASLSVNSLTPRRFFDKSIYVAKFPETITDFSGEEEELIPEPLIKVDFAIVGVDFNFKKTEAEPQE